MSNRETWDVYRLSDSDLETILECLRRAVYDHECPPRVSNPAQKLIDRFENGAIAD